MRTQLATVGLSEHADDLETADEPAAAALTEHSAGRLRWPRALRGGGTVWLWVGIVIAVAGFVLIAIGWGQVASQTEVYLQLPYVVSAGLVGLALVMIGLAVLNIATRQRDSAERDRQIAQLAEILEELRDVMIERESRRRR